MSQCVDYEFRINKDFIDQVTLQDWCTAYCREWGFQLERGDSGYEHWQGHIKLMKKRRKNEVRTKCWTHEKWFCYFEPTCNNMRKLISDATGIPKFYSTKADTRLLGPFTSDDVEKWVPDHVKEFKPFPWQASLIRDYINNKNDRKVCVILDEAGGIGKSTLLTYLMTGDDNYYQCPPINNSKDLLQAICDQLMQRKDRDPKAIFIDLPRAMNKKCLAEIYTAIESIKDGFAYDIRYTYKQWRFNRPPVIVFTNECPDTKWLTPNRWNILGVNGQGQLFKRE